MSMFILDLTILFIVVNQSGLIKNNEYLYSLFLLAFFYLFFVIGCFIVPRVFVDSLFSLTFLFFVIFSTGRDDTFKY
jgi:hypothetical protein